MCIRVAKMCVMTLSVKVLIRFKLLKGAVIGYHDVHQSTRVTVTEYNHVYYKTVLYLKIGCFA